MTTLEGESPTASLGRRAGRLLRDRAPIHLERASWDSRQIAEHQQQALRDLLSFARTRSRFHAERLKGIHPGTFVLDDLPSLPIMTKPDMMARLDDVLTDPRLSRNALDEHLAGLGPEIDLLHDEFFVLSTGGSSGHRGVFVYAVEGFCEAMLSCLRRSLLPGPDSRRHEKVGPPRGAIVAAATSVHATAAMSKVSRAGELAEIHVVAATLPLDEIVGRLNALRPDLLTGYPSVLVRLAAERSAGRLEISPRAINGTSELMSPEMALRIEAAFGVSPGNVFGSTEGLFGSALPGEEAMTFSSDCCIVELVDEQNRAVPLGTPSAKILITNLYNRVQPLIRYELSDHMIQAPPGADSGHLRATVRGRADSPFRYGSVEVHPLAIRTVLVQAPGILEYQVRQTRTGVAIALVLEGSPTMDLEALRARLVESLQKAGLNQPSVELQVVDTVRRSATTGKAARFIPLR